MMPFPHGKRFRYVGGGGYIPDPDGDYEWNAQKRKIVRRKHDKRSNTDSELDSLPSPSDSRLRADKARVAEVR